MTSLNFAYYLSIYFLQLFRLKDGKNIEDLDEYKDRYRVEELGSKQWALVIEVAHIRYVLVRQMFTLPTSTLPNNDVVL